jgi:valyl-tRNA synthetase
MMITSHMPITNLPKAYEPQKVEDEIYRRWEQSGSFNPDHLTTKPSAPSFSIAMPPPNATGTLHVGHAMMLALEDLMIRYHRMWGDRTLWLPGTDHAAIATQNVVEKQLKKEGKTKDDLGREAFVQRVDAFVKDSQGKIKKQIRKMGASCDWSRERYTLDEGLSAAVGEVFIRMFHDGLIYRGRRIVNWCPRCESTLADDEVEHQDVKGTLYTFHHGPFEVSSTRPETKLGDTAVAVHPTDRRYKKHVGETYDVDFGRGPQQIRVIADREVDPKFGTGIIGVTPAHAMVDFRMAQEQHLEIVPVIGSDGTMLPIAGLYAGLPIAEARKRLLEDWRAKGILLKEEEHLMALSTCYRCGTAIEPLISKQWFVDVNAPRVRHGTEWMSMKDRAIDVVKKGEIHILPPHFTKTYFHWMEHLQDWCISRQLWFGHRIPAWKLIAKKPVVIRFYTHGTTIDNEKDLSSGHHDSPLSPLGITQSHELKELVRKERFDVVFCSDLDRAVQTAKIAFEGTTLVIDPRLRELNYGKWNGKPKAKVDPFKVQHIVEPFPQGESYLQSTERINAFLADVAKQHPGKRIAIIGHRATQYALESLLNGKPLLTAVTEPWAWQPGWDYLLEEVVRVQATSPGRAWVQDPDVLDTWFSSGLWTFSTLGWPKQTLDLQTFHPTSVLETGYDILFFWVAKMIMMSTYAMENIPFRTVYLHGLVRDRDGRKMSKSLGNGIDPLDMIEKYGADAVRLSLVSGTAAGQDIRLYEEKIGGFRNFTNKLYNVARYILSQEEDPKQPARYGQSVRAVTLADQWILSRLQGVVQEVTRAFHEFRFSDGIQVLYDFLWHDVADWYLEISKSQRSPETHRILHELLGTILKLAHPAMPYVTEYLWKMLAPHEDLLIIQPWPTFKKKLINPTAEHHFGDLQSIVGEIRHARSEYHVDSRWQIPAVILSSRRSRALKGESPLIEILARVTLTWAHTLPGEKHHSIELHPGGMTLLLPLGAMVDVEKERERLIKELEIVRAALEAVAKKLSNRAFLAKAPQSVVFREKEKQVELQERQRVMKEALMKLPSKRTTPGEV